MYKPYVIVSPDFDVTSGGIRVMWGLFGWLLAKGQIVYMNRWPAGDTIGIYPEILHGNPAHSKTVVRYILNKPGVMGGTDQFGNFTPGPTSFDSQDKIYVFSKIFDTFKSDYNHLMFLPIINTKIFKDQKKKRTKSCYIIGKGTNRMFHPKGSIELNRHIAQNQEDLADILNECEVLYCYDKLTAMLEVARLCGCRVQYYGGYNPEEMELYEPGLNGIGLDGEEKKLYTEEFREHYHEMVKTFEKKLDYFIEETQS